MAADDDQALTGFVALCAAPGRADEEGEDRQGNRSSAVRPVSSARHGRALLPRRMAWSSRFCLDESGEGCSRSIAVVEPVDRPEPAGDLNVASEVTT